MSNEFLDALIDDDAEELYDHAPCAYLSLLPDGTVAKVNQTFLNWTGYERADIVGKRRFAELLAPGDRIYYETHLSPMLLMQGRIREVAMEVVSPSGARLPVIGNAVARRADDGTPLMLRVALFDATERRIYERQLVAAREQAVESEARAVSLARTLQQTLLPPTLVRPTGMEIGAAYRPAGDGSNVGGDFYDAFETGDGHVVIVIGDVSGKGVEAAVLTSLARHTIRSAALRNPDPATVLRSVSDAFVQYHPDRYCTAAAMVIGPAPRDTALIACGGHHLPLLAQPDGHIAEIGRPGQMLGLLPDPALEVDPCIWAAGDTVVLFTDGVVEARRNGGDFFGAERLADVVTSAVAADAGAQGVADAVVGAALEFQNNDAADDIAVVTVRYLDAS